MSLKAINMTISRVLSECAAAVKGYKPPTRRYPQAGGTTTAAAAAAAVVAPMAATTGGATMEPATTAAVTFGLPACKISLAHAWRISLVRADAWVSEGKLDATVPQRVRSRLLHLYCRRQGQVGPGDCD